MERNLDRLVAFLRRRYDVVDGAGVRIRAEYRSGALYVYFGDRAPSTSQVISEAEFIADFDERGRIAGLEVLEPWAPVPWDDLAQRCGFAPSLPAVLVAVAKVLPRDMDASSRPHA